MSTATVTPVPTPDELDQKLTQGEPIVLPAPEELARLIEACQAEMKHLKRLQRLSAVTRRANRARDSRKQPTTETLNK